VEQQSSLSIELRGNDSQPRKFAPLTKVCENSNYGHHSLENSKEVPKRQHSASDLASWKAGAGFHAAKSLDPIRGSAWVGKPS